MVARKIEGGHQVHVNSAYMPFRTTHARRRKTIAIATTNVFFIKGSVPLDRNRPGNNGQ
jgi:hypothetical protein